MALEVIVLAAGQGSRMRSRFPKVLQKLAGRPLLQHVLDTAAALAPSRIHVVVGHGADAVREAFADRGLNWVDQPVARPCSPRAWTTPLAMVVFCAMPMASSAPWWRTATPAPSSAPCGR